MADTPKNIIQIIDAAFEEATEAAVDDISPKQKQKELKELPIGTYDAYLRALKYPGWTKNGQLCCSCGRVYTRESFAELSVAIVAEGKLWRSCPCRAWLMS